MSKRKKQRETEDRPFDTPEIAALQEGHSVTVFYTWMDTPIYDSLGAIYRYQGGWAFEDNCDGWRPWSNAWNRLCNVPWVAGWPSKTDKALAKLRDRLLFLSKDVAQVTE